MNKTQYSILEEEFLKNKNILLEIKYYDNRNDGTD